MKVLMVTPHLPPHQAANALLPHLLGQALRGAGHSVRFFTFGNALVPQADVTRVARRSRALRLTRLPQLLEAAETWLKGRALVGWSDVVHVHSNTWMNQVTARLCVRARRPYVLTHYGTEIWHHDGKDPAFKRLNVHAAHVAYYSQALLERGRELRVPGRATSVVYPPVADVFRPRPEGERAAVRARFSRGALLLNVKRLHPLADQLTLLEAFGHLRRQRPDAVLLIAGSGEAEPSLRERAQTLNLGDHVRFLGLVPNDQVAELQAAADVFVLSSVLEATPTVALEALASGTPVVSTDNPGGVELHTLFGDDVRVVPKQAPDALATAVLQALGDARRARPETAEVLERRFRLPGVAAQYLKLYEQATLSA